MTGIQTHTSGSQLPSLRGSGELAQDRLHLSASGPSFRKPVLVLPRGSCDSHLHVIGPTARFPYASERSYTPDDAPVERLRELHRLLGIDRAVYVQPTVHGFDNSAILDAVARDPSHGRGVALVPTNVADAELRRLHAAGIRGVRFNFVKHLGETPNTAAVLRMAERIASLGWHVQLHFGSEDLLLHRQLLQQIQAPFVIDHMGRTVVADGLHQEAFVALLEVLADPRAWVKLSGPDRISTDLAKGGAFPYADVVPFARQLLAAAPDRALWGSDWPHSNVRELPADADLVDLLAQYGDEHVLQRLLVANPARLYGFV